MNTRQKLIKQTIKKGVKQYKDTFKALGREDTQGTCRCKPMWATPDSACPVHGKPVTPSTATWEDIEDKFNGVSE